MIKFFLFKTGLNLVFYVLGNIRTIATLSVVGSAVFFGYLVYQHDYDVEAAWDSVTGFWRGVGEFFRRGAVWLNGE